MGGGLTFTLKLQGEKVRVAMAAVAPGLGSRRPSLVGLGGSGSLRGSSAGGYFSVPCRKHLLGLSLPPRHLEMGRHSGVPWGGPREGTWARLLAGRKWGTSPQHSILASCLPGKAGGWASLRTSPLVPEPPGKGRPGPSWPSWLLVSLRAGSAGLASACQASSFPSLWEFGAWVGSPGRLDG